MIPGSDDPDPYMRQDLRTGERAAEMRAWGPGDVRDRQLAALLNTFPQWSISYERVAGGSWWLAAPSWKLTLEEVAAGALVRLRRGDPISLMADLTEQVVILHGLARSVRYVRPEWTPYAPKRDRRMWVVEASCCDAYQLVHEGREYFVTRWSRDGWLETGRGAYWQALGIWQRLDRRHRRDKRWEG
ncbi:hypothetical protein GCM10009850_057010 [Nonomuraea monospora]|uniref:Uncharacterized protein n=1 Tax=Nonomuraea monospora TaxID=568818 RepID=A0ABN3CLJ7_9ACTN